MTAPTINPLLIGLCDDAATFPPGNLPLEQAVGAHIRHRQSRHHDLVGPFVLGAKDLDAFAHIVARLEQRPATGALEVALIAPLSGTRNAVVEARTISDCRLAAVEVTIPAEMGAEDVAPALDSALSDARDVAVFVEVPRDQRRAGVLGALAGTRYCAKFRTGGVRAELYPDVTELADAIRSAVRAGVPFKATAGLHHAVRNTDPETGFEQHGFLNVLAATDAALSDATTEQIVTLLADRDGSRVAYRINEVSAETRGLFRSFGTCSIHDPVRELISLGLLPADLSGDLT
jgi:hypothetical protein